MYDLGFLPKGSLLKKLLWFKAVALSAASAIIKTVTGTAPITLTNAISHPIHSLTQYGKCVQDGTPTPAAPVDIVCNNGVLRMVDGELPEGYKRVLGFACNNNALWKITSFKLRGSDTVRISFSVTQACNVWGCYQGADATDNYDLYVSTTANSKYLRYGNGTYLSYWSSADLGERFDVVFSPTGTNGMPQDSTWTELEFESANDLLIGTTTTTGTSSKLRGNLYGDIIVDGRLKLIPCERVSDGVLGYYDTYSETFYEPEAGFTGAVSLGYDGSHYQLSVVGTPEVLTVSGENLLSRDGETTGKIINSTGSVSENSNYCISAPFMLSAGDYVCAWNVGASSSRPFCVFACEADGTPKTDGMLFYQLRSEDGINTGEFTVPQATFAVSSYRINATDLTVSAVQTASVPMLLGVGNYKDEVELISGIKTGRVGIKVLDGTENWNAYQVSAGTAFIQNATSAWGAVAGAGGYCTHLTVLQAGETTFAGSCRFATDFNIYEYKTAFGVADVAGFKAKLAEQYAAGTPVVVVYPLATATTEQTTPHELHTSAGTNIVSVAAEVSGISLAAQYKATE